MKFIDDLSIAVKVSLNNDLEEHARQKPLTFDERLGTQLKESSNVLQRITDSLLDFSNERQMKVNTKKSSVMKICISRTKTIPIEIDGNLLEVKKEMKILGVILQPNLKWSSNTEYLCKKAYKNMWAI